MLLNMVDFLRPINSLRKAYRGIVLSNDDPKKLGRIKVRVDGLIEGEIDELPWCYCKSPTQLGGSGSTSSFLVPNVASSVVVEFPFEDPYSPFYTGFWQTGETHQGLFNEDYPRSYGFQDEQGTWHKVNRAKQYAEFQHTSGASLKVLKDSTIELRSGKRIKFISEDEGTQFTFDMESGDLLLSPKGEYKVEGTDFKVNSKQVITETGSYTESISGAKNSKVIGGNKVIVGGSDSKSILSNSALSIAGNKSVLVAGTTGETYGLSHSQTVVLGNKTTTLYAGNFIVQITAGNIEITTIAGSAKIGNPIGKLEISATGNCKLSNLLGTLDISPTGTCKFSNPLASLELSPSGSVKLKNPTGSLELAPSGSCKLKNMVGNIEIDPAGMVKVKGTMIQLNGMGSGILTANSTMNVIDTITGIPVIPSPTVFGDI